MQVSDKVQLALLFALFAVVGVSYVGTWLYFRVHDRRKRGG